METDAKREKVESGVVSIRLATPQNAKPDSLPIGSPSNDMDANVKAINDALRSNSLDVFIPAGRYAINSMIYLEVNTGKKRIYGEYDSSNPNDPRTNTIIDTTFYTDTQNSVFHLYGSSRLIEEFSAPIPKGSSTYTFSNAENLQAGDLLVLSDPEEYSYGHRYYYKKGEVVEVTHYDAATYTVTFSPTVDSYSASCYVYKLSPLRDITIENIQFSAVNPNSNVWSANSAIRLRFCSRITLNNVRINEAAFYNGLIVDQSYDCVINSCKSKITAQVNKQNVYAVSVSNSQKITFNDIEAVSWWLAFATGGGMQARYSKDNNVCEVSEAYKYDVRITGNFAIVNRDIIVKDSTFILDKSVVGVPFGGTANFHGNTESSGFYGCTVIGAGFNIGGHNNTLRGNKIKPIYRNPAQPTLNDIGIYFNENIGVSFTIENNQYFVQDFRQNNISEENIYGEFLHLGLVNWWIADDKSDNPCRKQPDTTRCPLPVTGTFIFRDNHFIVTCSPQNANAPNIKSKMIRLCSIVPDQAIKNDMMNNPQAVPEMTAEISGNNMVAIDSNGTTVTPHTSGIDVCTDFLAIKEWFSFKSVTLRNNNLDRVRVSINTSSLFFPGSPNAKSRIELTRNKVTTYNNEGLASGVDPLITCKNYSPLIFGQNDFSNIGGDPTLGITDFSLLVP